MGSVYEPSEYWETRLRGRFDLTGVGYGLLGPNYNALMYEARLGALERAIGTIGYNLAGRRVLEVGCGSGFYTEYCSKRGVTDYVGVDIAAISVIELAKRYPQFRFLQSDITEETRNNEMLFDVVLIADVLFHIVNDDAFRVALQNAASSLKDGGLLILSDIFPRTTTQTALHFRSRSLEEYQSCFAHNGLRTLHVEPIFALLHPPLSQAGQGLFWGLYSSCWKYAWRIARFAPVDRVLPVFLKWLDNLCFLSRYGASAPNTKWLLAVKSRAS